MLIDVRSLKICGGGMVAILTWIQKHTTLQEVFTTLKVNNKCLQSLNMSQLFMECHRHCNFMTFKRNQGSLNQY